MVTFFLGTLLYKAVHVVLKDSEAAAATLSAPHTHAQFMQRPAYRAGAITTAVLYS
jgi:hypothetical protein